ncbi:hypothetical protein [Neobacillus cucumis]|nr:hypothetical protein [Neobacillus cucumis]
MNITFFLLYCIIVTFTPGPINIVIFVKFKLKNTKRKKIIEQLL